MKQEYKISGRFALIFIFLLVNVSGSIADTQSIIKQNTKLILQDKNYSKALVNLEKAIKTNSKNSELWYLLGIARYYKTGPQASIKAFDRALSLGLPKSYHWVSYLFRGRCNENLKKYDEAIRDITQTIKLKHMYVNAIEDRGRIYVKTRQFDLAHKDFDLILKNNKDNLGALRGKSWAYSKTGDYNRAIEYFTKLIKITSANNAVVLSEAYSGRAWSFYYLAQFEKARSDFNTAINKTPSDNIFSIQNSTIGKAFCLLGLGDRETALALIDQADKFSRPDKNLNHERVLIYYLAGDKQKAWNLRGGAGLIGVGLNENPGGDQGIYIGAVQKNSPALKSGLMKGDIITAVDGQDMADIRVFTGLIKKKVPGETAILQIIREGFEKKISVKVGSADKLLDNHILSKPILAARKASQSAEEMPVSTIQVPETQQEPLDVSGAGEPSTLIYNSDKVKTAGIQIDSVVIDPVPVQAGKHFEIIIDLIASNPSTSQSSLPVVMDYSILKGKKVLKKFKSKKFMVPNGEYFTLIRNPKAAKSKGSYSLLVELEYKEKKESKMLKFDIE